MSLDTLTQSGGNASNLTLNKRVSLTWLLPLGLLLGFLLVLAFLFGSRLIPATLVQTAPVVTARAAEGEQVTSRDGSQMLFQASGWVEPDPYTTYVPALINGIIDTLEVLEGQSVKKGQLLATLIDDEQKLALQAAKQKCESMEKTIDAHCLGIPIIEAQNAAAEKKIVAGMRLLDQERDNLKRLETIGGNAVSEQSIVQARFSVARHEALVAQAEAELPEFSAMIEQIAAQKQSMLASLSELKVAEAQAKLALDRTRITAPHDGIILHLHAAPGKKRMLQMDDPTSSVIVELYDPEKLQARIDVPLTEAAGLGVGQKVEMVSDLLTNKTFHGVVTRISGQADLQRNTLQAKVAIENPDVRLRPDMLVRAKFYSAPTENDTSTTSAGSLSLYVPESAMVGDSQIWVVNPSGDAELRSVELSKDRRDDHIRVLSGVKSGERVILPPHTELADGKRVQESNTPQ
ncbi:MAG: efflux RND transporter periplasmic adaptor subunit [Rubritalea sp.]|uniref:efflux RND transporter periplasmic adaptor subunit n=1 Tax=Rubritalea sp. TaxID=2109375 RepID=UPI0032420F6D